MKAKVKLFVSGCLAVCFWVLTIVALDVVPKLIGDDCYMIMGLKGKWSDLVSLLFYGMAAICGFYAWLVYRHIKKKLKSCGC